MKDLALKYINRDLYHDNEIALHILDIDPNYFWLFPSKQKDNSDIAMFAIQKDYYLLNYVSRRLKADKDFMMAAVKIDGGTFKMADKSLRKDRELLLTAIKTDGYAIKYTPRTLRNDPEIAFIAVKTTGYAIICIDDKQLQQNDELIELALKSWPYAIKYASKEYIEKHKEQYDAIYAM